MKKTTLQNREISELPKNFEILKREFQKVRNMYFAKSKVITKKAEEEYEKDEYEIPIEAKALFWVLMQEFNSFLTENEATLSEDLVAEMEDKNLKQICLPVYGIKVVWDDEAKWFFQKEMTKEDWLEYDTKCNEEFKKRKTEEK